MLNLYENVLYIKNYFQFLFSPARHDHLHQNKKRLPSCRQFVPLIKVLIENL